jgi:hypothetical protein
VLRTVLTIASGFALLVACGMGFDERPVSWDHRALAFFVAMLLALNLLYLFRTRPNPSQWRLWQLAMLWLDVKEKELRDRIRSKTSN